MTLLAKRNGNLMPDFFNLSRDLFDWNNSNFSNTDTSLPAVNIRESSDSFEVEMAAPGMTKKDFNIELNNNLLTISSEKMDKNERKEGERFTRKEFSYQSFQRSFMLPKEVVDDDKINARYENGVLYLHIPKKEEAKVRPPKQIAVK